MDMYMIVGSKFETIARQKLKMLDQNKFLTMGLLRKISFSQKRSIYYCCYIIVAIKKDFRGSSNQFGNESREKLTILILRVRA